MKKEKTKQNALKSQSEDPRYNKWVGHCKEEADESGFKGLLFAYLSGHDSDDYNKLVVGAGELLSDVHCRLIDNSDEYDNPDVCLHCKLTSLIYPNKTVTNSNSGIVQ